jgi:hypothetical protein
MNVVFLFKNEFISVQVFTLIGFLRLMDSFLFLAGIIEVEDLVIFVDWVIIAEQIRDSLVSIGQIIDPAFDLRLLLKRHRIWLWVLFMLHGRGMKLHAGA